MSRKNKKQHNSEQKDNATTTNLITKLHFQLQPITPITKNQEKAFKAYFSDDKELCMFGCAGSGKTFLAFYMALDSLLKSQEQRKIVIVRTAVQTRNQGYLPGNTKEKAAAFEGPYVAICGELFGRDDAYQILKQKGLIEFTTTSFIRGLTYDDCVLILDETQNFNRHEINSVLTRVGKNCRVIVCGDVAQNDLSSKFNEESGFEWFISVARKMKEFSTVKFDVEDIVRSGFVKSFIIASQEG